jgi:hypothetical protein
MDAVHRLTTNDFNLDSPDKITLKHNECYIIIFYIENEESRQLAAVFAATARQVVGPIFAEVNLNREKRLAETFTQLRSDGDHPLYWAGLQRIPFIMVYRGSWPVAIYNGIRSVQALVSFSLTLACVSGYREPFQTASSLHVDENLVMQGYTGAEQRTRSDQFTERDTNFDPRLPVVPSGSQAEKEAGRIKALPIT